MTLSATGMWGLRWLGGWRIRRRGRIQGRGWPIISGIGWPVFSGTRTGLFASKAVNAAYANGLFYGGGMTQFWIQLKTVGTTIAFAFIGTIVLLYIIKLVMGLRVTSDQEVTGLDEPQHGEAAYHI